MIYFFVVSIRVFVDKVKKNALLFFFSYWNVLEIIEMNSRDVQVFALTYEQSCFELKIYLNNNLGTDENFMRIFLR